MYAWGGVLKFNTKSGLLISGQINITNDPKLRSTASVGGGANQSKPLSKIASIQSKIASVEDFCPDGPGGGLGGFLEDVAGPVSSGSVSKVAEDSESDEESRGNPMVARFQDEQAEDDDPKSDPPVKATIIEVKVNPLAKSSKSAAPPSFDHHEFTGGASATHSNSSTDLDVAVEVEADDKETDFDNWINDTTRRSPEGGEDPTSCQISISQEPFQTSKLSPIPRGILMAKNGEEEDEAAEAEESEKPEKVAKKHKKKKSKEEKKDRDRDKEKKRKKKKESKHDSSGPEEDRLDASMRSMNVSGDHEDYECI